MAREIGIAPSTYGRYETERDLPGEVLAAIEANTPIRIQWLLSGEGKMFKTGTPVANAEAPTVAELPQPRVVSPLVSTNDRYNLPQSAVAEAAAYYLGDSPKADIVAALRRLTDAIEAHEIVDPEELARLLRTEPGPAKDAPVLTIVSGRDLSREERAGLEGDGEAFRLVPILEGRIAAGAPRQVWEEEIEDWAVCNAASVPHPASTSCVRVAGNSMAPDIPDSALVAVDHSVRDAREMQCRSGNPRAAVRDDQGGCVIRNVRLYGATLVCTPQNPGPDHPELTFDFSDENADNPIVGQVIWRWVSEI